MRFFILGMDPRYLFWAPPAPTRPPTMCGDTPRDPDMMQTRNTGKPPLASPDYVRQEIEGTELLMRLDDAIQRLREGRHGLANALTAMMLHPSKETSDKVDRAAFHATKGADISLKAIQDPL